MAMPSVAALSSTLVTSLDGDGSGKGTAAFHVKQERPDDAEINAMAEKIKETNRAKMAAMPAAGTRSGAAGASGTIMAYMPRAGARAGVVTPVAVAQVKGEKPPLDEMSQKGKFSWVTLGGMHLPYIMRGESDRYCAVRMVETKLLGKYLNFLHADIYSCTCIRSYYITEAEARLLNEINHKHCEAQFGRESFTTKDLVVRLQDATEFYSFLDVCYNKLSHTGAPVSQGDGAAGRDKCGFIRINADSVVPYTVRGSHKYVPLFYFEGETDSLKLRAEQLDNWDLAYLKFCCKVQGIRNELFASETCSVISLSDIKSYFPAGTSFAEYWPNKVMDSQLLLSPGGGGMAGGGVVGGGSWIKAPPPSAATPQSAPAAAAIVKVVSNPGPTVAQRPSPIPPPQQQQPPPPTPVHNGWPGLVGGQPTYQAVATTHARLAMQHSINSTNAVITRPTYQQQQRTNSMVAAMQYYPSPVSHGMPMASPQGGHVPQQPPPLVRSTVPQPTIGSTTYANASMLPNSSAISHMLGLSDRTNAASMLPPPPHLQYQALSGAGGGGPNVGGSIAPQQQPKYPPPLIPVANGANQRYLYGPGAEVIDLSSPPQSPQHQQQQQQQQQQRMGNGNSGVLVPQQQQVYNGIWKNLIPIMETQPNPGSHCPYKMQKALVSEKMVPCINAKPFISSELLITIPDLVSHFFPSVSLTKCREVLQDVLQVTLYRGNTLQMQVLRQEQKCSSLTDVLPLIQMRDVIGFMPQLKYILERASVTAMGGGGDGVCSGPKRARTS